MSHSSRGFSFIFIATVSVCRSLGPASTTTSAWLGLLGNPSALCHTCFGSLFSLSPNYHHVLVTRGSRAAVLNISADLSSDSPLPSSPCFSSFARQCSPRTLIQISRYLNSTSIWLTYFTLAAWPGRICPCSSARVHSCAGPRSAVCTWLSIFRIDPIGNCCVAHSRIEGDQLAATMN